MFGVEAHPGVSPSRIQVLLDESRAEMHVDLHQGLVANAAEAMDLSGLDHENIPGTGLEFLSVHSPDAAPSRTNCTSSYG